jgi:hypothetical protein
MAKNRKTKSEDAASQSARVDARGLLGDSESGRGSPAAPISGAEATAERERFSFPTVSACPRCRGTQTRAISTQGNRQYRVCCAPVCQFHFCVKGAPV